MPGEERARRMKQREYLYCILQQWLDEEEQLENLCPACLAQVQERRCSRCGAPLADTDGMENTAFDMERYRRLKEGETGCSI